MADCVISNCVINLAPDKPAVLREIARVLKPGGRLAASDIALKRDLPEEIAGDLMAYVGCIAGAVLIDDYRRMLLDSGFDAVEVVDTGADLNAYAKVDNQAACCPPPSPSAAAVACCAPDDDAEQCCSPAPASTALPIAGACCSPSTTPDDGALHERLADLLRRHDVNSYAASVRIFALKPA